LPCRDIRAYDYVLSTGLNKPIRFLSDFFPAQNIPRATVSAPRALAIFLFRSYKKNKSGFSTFPETTLLARKKKKKTRVAYNFCVVDSVAALNGDKRIFVFSADMSTSEPQHLMSVELRQFTKRTNN
jgi:hypothetical protein